MAKQADPLSVEDARARILGSFRRLDTQHIGIDESVGRVLAEDVRAPIDLPPFDNSSMDGFAVRSSSTIGAGHERPVHLRVESGIAAGAYSSQEVLPEESARIMTGAPLPPGADAVIPFEDVVDLGHAIAVSSPVKAGASVRFAGQDVRAGVQVLSGGAFLSARHVGLLAALGIGQVPVVRRPLVALLATGDELVSPGTPLRPGQIYNSNSPMLSAAIREAGGDVVVLPAARDDASSIAAALTSVAGVDLLVTTGGASVGDFDYVKDVVGAGGSVDFWRVRMRPGKPLLFGKLGNLPIIGLPGNPTSAMVTFEQFVRPVLHCMLGAALLPPTIQARLDEPIDNRGGRRTFSRARLRYEAHEFHVTLSGPQDSAMLVPLAQADGVVIVPEERDELLPGEMVTVQIWKLPDS